ncbi:MAG: hypothetical protein WCN95_09970 [bacterium]
MNEQNDKQNQVSGNCDGGCSCNTARPAGKTRVIVGVIVLVVAGVLVARAVVKDKGTATAPAPGGFAALAATEQPSRTDVTAAPSDTIAAKEIASLSELNVVATNSVGVFIYVPGKSEAIAKAPVSQMLSAVRTMEPQLKGGKIGIFSLKTDSRDSEQVASQMTVPVVLVMVKGGGMAPVSGEITETKLVQAYVTASSASGCGPASSGCGPSGCK